MALKVPIISDEQDGIVLKKAVVILSGGMDSTTAAYIAKARGYAIVALHFDYGQRHARELECAKKIREK